MKLHSRESYMIIDKAHLDPGKHCRVQKTNDSATRTHKIRVNWGALEGLTVQSRSTSDTRRVTV